MQKYQKVSARQLDEKQILWSLTFFYHWIPEMNYTFYYHQIKEFITKSSNFSSHPVTSRNCRASKKIMITVCSPKFLAYVSILPQSLISHALMKSSFELQHVQSCFNLEFIMPTVIDSYLSQRRTHNIQLRNLPHL